MTTTREELELQVAMLRDALSNCLVEHPDKPFVHLAAWRVKQALSTPFSPTALAEFAEKVERMTIERCAAEISPEWYSHDFSKHVVEGCCEAIRALPTGQIKVEELLK